MAFSPEFLGQFVFQFINRFTDAIFFLDIIANFRTTYVNPSTGDEISNPKLIACAYLKRRFWVDLLATFPFDEISIDIF